MKKLVGLELELMLVDSEGKIVNRADEVINHELNSGYLLRESTHGVVEVISKPSASLRELEGYFKAELMTLEEITKSLGLKAVPISEIGPENSLIPRIDSKRYALNAKAHGEQMRKLSNSLCGTHSHLDHESDLVSQYNLMQSTDPIFALMSTSPYLRGKNSFNACRVNAYRNEVFSELPLHGQLLDYAESFEQLDKLSDIRLEQWLNLFPAEDEAHAFFDKFNTAWGPIRYRENTIELRGSDANTLSHVMAKAAMEKGIVRYVFDNGLEVKASEQDGDYGITDSEIIMPSNSTLKTIEGEAMRQGLKSDLVHGYLSHLMEIAEGGLPNDEICYLGPFKEMLKERKNVADRLYDFAKKIDPTVSGKISAETAAKVNLHMGDMYQNDLAMVVN